MTPQIRHIAIASVDLMTDSGIGTQAVYGQRFRVESVTRDHATGTLLSVVQDSMREDYAGSVPLDALASALHTPTHVVDAVAAAVFADADIKSKLVNALPRNAVVAGQGDGSFVQVPDLGFIHARHLRPVGQTSPRSYTDIAADMLGLPYVWGGTGHVGVDCSGLVQSALAATGVDVPRNAGQQERAIGKSVAYDDRERGDLLFWPGHVGIVVAEDRLLHANAHHMCVAVEPVTEAVARIGAVRMVRRLDMCA